MKTTLIIALFFSIISTSAFASKFCEASKKTVTKIDELRNVELPYKVVENEIIKTLIADKCVRSKLQNEEIYTLTQLLLAFENNEENTSSIIGEFIAL